MNAHTLQKKKVPEAGQRQRKTVLNSSLHTSDGLQLTVFQRERIERLRESDRKVAFKNASFAMP